jgi:hypothetical protein
MDVVETVEACLTCAKDQHAAAQLEAAPRVIHSEPETIWHKVDHLLYLPLLGLCRPRDLYYYQGQGLKVLHGFTYKYLTLEHFLGELTQLQVGYPLADALADRYSQAWYPGQSPLLIFTDWHTKPHWTKSPAHSGHITMLERVMPGTKQLVLNGPDGHLLGGWNDAMDTHLSQVLVDLEADLATKLKRPIAYNVFDSEGSGLPTALRYEAAQRDYLSVLPRQDSHTLSAFAVVGEWEPVENDAEHEAVFARWTDPQKVREDPRRLVLMRPLGETDPTRIYTGRIPQHLSAGAVPARFRQRWMGQERVIRQLVNGANLNANFGYQYTEVSNRTQQRRWDDAQEKVQITERHLAEQQEALHNLHAKLQTLRHTYRQEQQDLRTQIEAQVAELAQRQAAGQTWRRSEQRWQQLQRQSDALTARFQRQRLRLLEAAQKHWLQRNALQRERVERCATRDAIDTESLCRERNLQKDQVMLDLQVLLASLHDWARQHYFAPDWQHLELDTATELIYRKSGRVRWGREDIEVTLDPYRYPEHQRAMQETCQRFNAAQVRWRDGRLLRMRVAEGV